jgi:alpha/beta superfamily hydrolase
MPEIIFPGPGGRLEGRYHISSEKRAAPLALILHQHPQFAGHMNNPLIYRLYYAFAERGFSVLRFNLRGVGRSEGSFDYGNGELADAVAALDWLQATNPDSHRCWIAGVSFGAWVGMQLLMRRPEVDGFISISPMVQHHDFSFLAPCPSSGLFIHGTADSVAPLSSLTTTLGRVKVQRGVRIDLATIEGANHFFDGKMENVLSEVNTYLDQRLASSIIPPVAQHTVFTLEDTPLSESLDLKNEEADIMECIRSRRISEEANVA